MSFTSCGTGMLVLSAKVGSLFSLAFTRASSIGTCVNRLVTLKLTRRYSSPVRTSCSLSTNLVEFITVYLVCHDSGKVFGQSAGQRPNARYNGSHGYLIFMYFW